MNDTAFKTLEQNFLKAQAEYTESMLAIGEYHVTRLKTVIDYPMDVAAEDEFVWVYIYDVPDDEVGIVDEKARDIVDEVECGTEVCTLIRVLSHANTVNYYPQMLKGAHHA